MAKSKAVVAGDACPQCGGAFVLDPTQNPERLIAGVTLNAQNDAAAARYADQVRAKVEEHGLVHKCVVCGYRSRFQPAAAAEGEPAPAPAADAKKKQPAA